MAEESQGDMVLAALKKHLVSGTITKVAEADDRITVTIVSPHFTRGTLAKLETEAYDALGSLTVSGALTKSLSFNVTTGYTT